jgi:hypothetical protein
MSFFLPCRLLALDVRGAFSQNRRPSIWVQVERLPWSSPRAHGAGNLTREEHEHRVVADTLDVRGDAADLDRLPTSPAPRR